MKENVEILWPRVTRIKENILPFDVDVKTPGNGYRSFLYVVHKAIETSIQLNEKVHTKRESTFFRKTYILKDLESFSQIFASLETCFKHLEIMIANSTEGCLFLNDSVDSEVLLSKFQDIKQNCFYGRSMGFQFCESLKSILQFVAMSMAIFSEFYYSRGSFLSKATSSVMNTTKYIHDAESRAQRVVNISRNADIAFCKAFWFLSESELMCTMPLIVSPSVAVSKVISIPSEPLTLQINGKDIQIPIPESHIGRKPIQVRLISYDVHDNMIGETLTKGSMQPPSRGLLFHCHGGGFVAQSSLSHECYLREWAKQLRVPILSVDYSLAPEAPFPRALEEVTYAYCWAMKNFKLLGTTGERVVAAGDSAGGNLVLTLTLKCLHLGVPPPIGLFVAYAPTVVNANPSPARLLCVMDALLPFGFLMRCLKAYAHPEPDKDDNINVGGCGGGVGAGEISDTESFEEISESDLQELQARKSPISEASDTLSYGSFMSNDGNFDNDAQEYSTEYLGRYIFDSDTDINGTKIPVLQNKDSESSSQVFDYSLQSRLTNFIRTLKWRFGNWVSNTTDFKGKTNAEKYLDNNDNINFLDEFKFIVPKDPYLSPYYGKDEDLKHFPPVRVLTVHLDPCLDDCVMFTKKLKQLGNDANLEILHGLSHGFLNFSLLSKEAYDASMKCVKTIRNLFDLNNVSNE